MSDNTQNNKRIAKNTVILYLRMFIMMAISLYTARIVLNTLGFDNYGIYQVVGSIIVLFSFLNNGLSVASNRFITAEIAKGDAESGRKVFNICIKAHIIIALVILVFAETIGLFIVNTILDIPENRIIAANIVYQLSIISAIVSIICSPFNTTLIAYERMNIFAYLAIFDAVMKLSIVFIIQAISYDKLISYAFFLLLVTILHTILNYLYCQKNFVICRLKKVKDTALLKSIFSFTSWSLLGQACIVGTNQGVSIIINYFCGITINAAMGISNQILHVVSLFVTNFQTAFRPQIVKSYVNNNTTYLQSLILRSSKITSCLMLVLMVPIIVELPNLLNIWLGKYPEYSIEFARWTIIALFFDTITGPLWMTINAQTNIKKYQIWTSIFFSMNFFIGWVILALNLFPPYAVIVVRVFVYAVLIIVRLYFTKKMFSAFNIKEWITSVFINSIIILSISLSGVYLLQSKTSLPIWQELIFVTIISEIIICVLCYTILLSGSERKFINRLITKLLHIQKK